MAAVQRVAWELVRGAFDLHVHSAPDIVPRKDDDIGLARRASRAGLGGFVLKNHFVGTAGRAANLRKMFPDLEVFGGLVLNNAVGGLNPEAVEVAGRLGAKVVWLPTVDAANQASVAGDRKGPSWAQIVREVRGRGVAGEPIRVIDDDGALIPAAEKVLEVVSYYDMILATGHLSATEIMAVVKAARCAAVRRIVITHPEFPTISLGIDEQRELRHYGVFFERCYLQAAADADSWELVCRNIREVGPESTILSTDVGQTTSPHQTDAMVDYVSRLLVSGFTESQIRTMSRDNPLRILEVPGVKE